MESEISTCKAPSLLNIIIILSYHTVARMYRFRCFFYVALSPPYDEYVTVRTYVALFLVVIILKIILLLSEYGDISSFDMDAQALLRCFLQLVLYFYRSPMLTMEHLYALLLGGHHSDRVRRYFIDTRGHKK